MKKALVITTAFLIALTLTGCIGLFIALNDDRVPRDEIFSYVNTNYELLETFPYDELEEIKYASDDSETKEQKKDAFIKKHLGDDTIVKSVYAYNENILDFYCGGTGMLKHSSYSGFYFSKEDIPFAFEFGDVALTETESDVFEWEDKRHNVHVEKIRDNWWYYLLEWI